MALTTAAEQVEVIPTVQTFPGPNRTVFESKNVVSSLEINVNGNPDNMPAQYKCVDLVGYFDLSSLTAAGDQATLYVGTIFDKAPIGSMYRQITTDANGVVIGAQCYVKVAATATAAAWAEFVPTAITIV